MIVLSCKNLIKSYGIDEILKGITFSINDNDKVGLIGANGEGKSTLFKILMKELSYDDGELFIDKNKSVGYLSQHLDLSSENTIYDEMLSVFEDLTKLQDKISLLEQKLNEPYDETNAEYHEKLIKDYTLSQELFEKRGGYTYRGEISKVVKGLGFSEEDYSKEVSTLSGGQKTRVALCKLLLIKPEILLLDEPTNHLDLLAIEWLEEYLKSYKGTVLVISHDRFFLDSVTTSTFELRGGKIYSYNAPYSKFIELREKDIEAQVKAYNLQQAEIKRQEEIIEKFRSFNREKSIRAAESREKALAKIDRLDSPVVQTSASKIKFETRVKSGNDVLHVENLKKSYGDKVLFQNLSLDIKRGEKIALIGENGRGKTTLLKILMDKINADCGSKVLGRNVNIGYYDQEQSDLNINKTIIDEVWDTFPNLTTTEVRTVLASFLFKGEDVFKEISHLSGGERCRINLLKLILSQSNFLLLDEPTNHLDILSREALEDAILNYDGTLLVISHDRYFLNKVIEKIYELNEDGIKTYLGNYNYYIDKKNNPNRFEDLDDGSVNGKTKTQLKEERKKKREAEKESKKVVLRFKEVEKLIAKNEEELENLNAQLCLEEVYSNPEECGKVNKKIAELNSEIEALYEEWEELDTQLN
ncbi:ribosomal protection-like ABC-F family protein [Inconstantimicrobium mannanitabidum]|uniref:Thiamine ABC transporter substrate-binding protein n=1 Tax=Inconstantimicrobium mannanitabidum TaxID=1604901 RepID=A0ACB5RDZ3_9CLOT|nr:ABC-F family ATP-binding cassette domain-containing protein [Clostridium sp. TW13]GKX66976.1 thiamine ABC transporter substrate-binding protein [Clostridium sp. TW13]